jgi:selenocysteine lyase/cysteine desulfurase
LELLTLNLDYPLSDKEVLDLYEEAYKKDDITLSIIDVISSKPGVKLPFKELTEQAKNHNVLSLVDAAHGIGLIDFNLDELNPDFFASDLYKWYYTPRGSAFLYVNPKHQKFVHSLPVSHFYIDSDEVLPTAAQEKTRFADQFNYTGANLLGNVLTVKAASEFIEEIGGLKRVQDYNFKLAKEVGEAVAKQWNTRVLENEEGTLLSSLVSVEYPVQGGVTINESDWETFNIYKLIREAIEKKLIKEHKTTAPIFYHSGKVWIRFSAQIYSELDDYVEAAKRIREGVDEYLASNAYKKIIGHEI